MCSACCRMNGPKVSVDCLSCATISPRSIGGGRSSSVGGGANLGAAGYRRGMRRPVLSAADAVADVRDGATLVFGGFGVMHGWPTRCLEALRDRGVRDLTLVCNTPGLGPTSSQILVERDLVRRLVCSLA